jgi:pSer/pThr/pTyr-binding forkhead associated (FHA) protein
MKRNTNKTEVKKNNSNFLTVLTGINDISKKALLDKELIINNFPTTFGRKVPADFSFYNNRFVQIYDKRPYCISPKQFSLVINKGQVYIRDENSKFGAIVNGEPLGESASGKKIIQLKQGKNVVQLGGDISPLIFLLEIKNRKKVNDPVVSHGISTNDNSYLNTVS